MKTSYSLIPALFLLLMGAVGAIDQPDFLSIPSTGQLEFSQARFNPFGFLRFLRPRGRQAPPRGRQGMQQRQPQQQQQQPPNPNPGQDPGGFDDEPGQDGDWNEDGHDGLADDDVDDRIDVDGFEHPTKRQAKKDEVEEDEWPGGHDSKQPQGRPRRGLFDRSRKAIPRNRGEARNHPSVPDFDDDEDTGRRVRREDRDDEIPRRRSTNSMLPFPTSRPIAYRKDKTDSMPRRDVARSRWDLDRDDEKDDDNDFEGRGGDRSIRPRQPVRKPAAQRGSKEVIEGSSASFTTQVLKSKVPVVVVFGATWCGPCQNFKGTVSGFAAQYGEKVKVVHIDTDQNPDLKDRYKITGIPATIVFKDGEVVTKGGSQPNVASMWNWVTNVL